MDHETDGAGSTRDVAIRIDGDCLRVDRDGVRSTNQQVHITNKGTQLLSLRDPANMRAWHARPRAARSSIGARSCISVGVSSRAYTPTLILWRMSRGHGTVQRRILAALREHAEQHDPMADHDPTRRHPAGPYRSFLDIARLAAADTPSALESTRRAIKKLEAEGVVDTRILPRLRWRSIDGGPERSLITPQCLCGRLSLVGAVADAWNAAEEAKRQKLDARLREMWSAAFAEGRVTVRCPPVPRNGSTSPPH